MMWDIREKTDSQGGLCCSNCFNFHSNSPRNAYSSLPKSFATLDQIRFLLEIMSLSVYPGYTSIFIKPISTSPHLKYKNENCISSNKVRTMVSLTQSKWWGKESSGIRGTGSSHGGKRDSSSWLRTISTVLRKIPQNYQKWGSFCLRQAFPYKTSAVEWSGVYSQSVVLFSVEADQHWRSLAAGQERLPHNLHQPEGWRSDVLETPGGHQRLVLPPSELGLWEQAEEEVLGERSNTWWRWTW